jgi:hypothetical protein
MIRKARLAIRKVNVALNCPGYYFGTGRSLIRPLKKINQETRKAGNTERCRGACVNAKPQIGAAASAFNFSVGTGRALNCIRDTVCLLVYLVGLAAFNDRTFSLAEEYQVNENA